VAKTEIVIAARAYKQYQEGNPLKDWEVYLGAEVFRRFAEELREFGPEFKLVADEFAQKATAFEEMACRRKHPRPEDAEAHPRNR
jgi:hypothetical protein